MASEFDGRLDTWLLRDNPQDQDDDLDDDEPAYEPDYEQMVADRAEWLNS